MNKIKYSKEHAKYLARVRLKTFSVIITQISILVAFILGWELLSKYGVLDRFLFSAPSLVWKTLKQMYSSGELIKHSVITLNETLTAFFLASGIGFVVAVLLWCSEFLRRVLEPFIVVLNSLPKIALGPIIIVWMGAGNKAIVTMGILIVVIVTIINILGAFLNADKNIIAVAKSLGANKFQIFTKIVLPSAIPDLVSTLKINVGLSCGTVKLCRLVKVFKPYYTMSKPSHFYKKSHLSNKNLLGFPNRFFNILCSWLKLMSTSLAHIPSISTAKESPHY